MTDVRGAVTAGENAVSRDSVKNTLSIGSSVAITTAKAGASAVGPAIATGWLVKNAVECGTDAVSLLAKCVTKK